MIFYTVVEHCQCYCILKGNILRSDIDGCIQMKIFMAGNPEIRIGLNEDFFIGKSDMLTQGILSARFTIIIMPG